MNTHTIHPIEGTEFTLHAWHEDGGIVYGTSPSDDARHSVGYHMTIEDALESLGLNPMETLIATHRLALSVWSARTAAIIAAKQRLDIPPMPTDLQG